MVLNYIKLVNKIYNLTQIQRIIPTILVGMIFLVLCPKKAFSQWVPSEKIMSKAELTIQKIFDVDYVKSPIPLNANYYVLSADDSILGYMCLEQAPSKHEMFDFLAIYSADMQLIKLKILAYRENYGGEIANKRWLNQFLTRPIEKVQAISGATISVESMKMVVSSLSQKMNDWHSAQSLTED